MKRGLLLLALLLCACAPAPLAEVPVGYGTHVFAQVAAAATPTPFPADLYEAQAQATRAAGFGTATAGAQMAALAASATSLHLSVVGTAGAQMATDQVGAATVTAEQYHAARLADSAQATATVGAMRAAGTATAVRLELAAMQDARLADVAHYGAAGMWLAAIVVVCWLALWLGLSISNMGEGLRLKWAGQGQEAKARGRLLDSQAELLRRPAVPIPNPDYLRIQRFEKFLELAEPVKFNERDMLAAGIKLDAGRFYCGILQDFGALRRGNAGSDWVTGWGRDTFMAALRAGSVLRVWPADGQGRLCDPPTVS
jgi:hypothetical protein